MYVCMYVSPAVQIHIPTTMLELSAPQIQQPVHTGLTKTCILSQKSFKISFATLLHIKMYHCSLFKSTSSSTPDVRIHDPQLTSMPVLGAPQIQHQVHCICSFTVSSVK